MVDQWLPFQLTQHHPRIRFLGSYVQLRKLYWHSGNRSPHLFLYYIRLIQNIRDIGSSSSNDDDNLLLTDSNQQLLQER